MKKSIAALLAIVLVLTSLFALNLIASAEGEVATVGKIAIANGYAENQSYASNNNVLRTTVSNHTLASGEPLYTAGYTTVYKYEYNMLQADGTYYQDGYNKYLSQKKAFSYTTGFTAANVGAAAKYARFFVRVPVDTKITLNLANGWSTVYTKTVDVKAVNGGAGYSEIVISLTDAEISDKTINNTFVYVANGILARECSTIYVSGVELWDSQPTTVLDSTEQQTPEWLLTTNNYINKPASVKTSNYSMASEKNIYWQNVSAATVTEFTFYSQEDMETYYSTSERELRFEVNTKDGYISSALTGLEAPLNMSNFEGAYISMWIKAPKNMQFDISTCNSNWGRPYTKVTVNVTEENNGWQEVRIPITDNTTAYNLSSVVVRPTEATDYATTWNYGESLYISWPQIVKNVDTTLGSALVGDINSFGESVENTFGYSTSGENNYRSLDGSKIGLKIEGSVAVGDKTGINVALATAEGAVDYYSASLSRSTNGLFFAGGTLTQQQYDYGYIKFYVKTSKSIKLMVSRYDTSYGQNKKDEVAVAASGDGLTEVIVPVRDMGGASKLDTLNYIVMPATSAYSKEGFIGDNETLFISDIELCVDMTSAAITDANTITAEMTADTSDAENGFTGLRKLTVKDSGFYSLADTDRAITHTFGSTVNQADVDYLGFWVKAPKAMNLALTFTDSYGVTTATNVTVNGTLKQGGYQFVTLSREQLKLNYLADIVSLTLTPAAAAEEFLSDNEALYYSAFTLYSGKPVSFYESYKSGDANGNGVVDIRDMVRAASGTDITYAADLAENGKIDSADMVAFRNILLEIE